MRSIKRRTRQRRCLFAIVIAAAVGGAALAKPVAIRNVRIFDGDKVIEPGVVVFDQGRISDVGPSVAIPRGAKVIDGTGKTLIPGLIDAHVHFIGSFESNGPLALQQAAAYGITTVQEMGGGESAGKFQTRLRKGEFPGAADIFLGGGNLDRAKTAADANKMVAELKANGSDHLSEVAIDDNQYHYEYRVPATDEMLRYVAAAGKQRGLVVAVHTMSQAQAKLAVLDGADGLIHITPYEPPAPDFGRFMVAHGAWQSTNTNNYAPKSYRTEMAEDPAWAPFFTPSQKAHWANRGPIWDSRHACSVEALKILRTAGAQVVAGTDIGFPYPPILHVELKIFAQDAGFTPVEALKTATSASVDAYQIKDRGRIKPGLRADMVLISGDPTKDITATKLIDTVWVQGVKVDRAAAAKLNAALPADSLAAFGRQGVNPLAPAVPLDPNCSRDLLAKEITEGK